MSLLLYGITYRPQWDCFLCNSCRYGVRPDQVHAHWSKRHLIKGNKLRTIKDLCHSLRTENPQNHIEIPLQLETADPILFLYNNAFQCQIDKQLCRYICRGVRDIRQHCRESHRWSEFGRRGRPAAIVRGTQSTELEAAWVEVSCQRIFPSGPDSSYIRVREPSNNDEMIQHVSSTSYGLYERHQLVMKEQRDRIDDSYEYDGDRWLKRTGWRKFLAGSVRSQALIYVVDPGQTSPSYESKIWDAVASLITRAEKLLSRTSHFVRVAVVQVEQSHHIQQPLQPYQDYRQLRKGIRAWQQIVLFFVRYSLGGLDLAISLSDIQKETLEGLRAKAESFSYGEDRQQNDDEDLVSMSELERGVLFFIISLLDYVVRGWEYESPLICALAVIALQPKGWLGLDRFPSILSALIKTSRYLVLQEAYEAGVQDGVEIALTTGPRLEDVERLTYRFLRRGTRSPFEWMFDLRSYGQNLAMQTTSSGKISWNGDRLSYGDVSLDLSQLRRMVSLLAYDTRQILDSSLLFNLRVPSIALHDLADDPTSSEAGFSFVRLPRNGEHLKLDGSRWLLDRVVGSPYLQPEFFTDRTSNVLKASPVNHYIQNVNRFRTNLAVLCHITSGQPARATELLSIRHRNSYEGEQRGVYIDGGLVNLTTSYYKGSTIGARADVNIIQRYLPESVGQIVVRYLWLVLPWIELLETQYYSRTMISDHFWPDKSPGHAFDEDSFRTAFKHIVEQYTGCSGVNISSYRHIAIAMSRKYLTTVEQFVDVVDASDEQGDTVEETTPLDAQASHSSYVAQLVYGRDGQAVAGSLLTSREKFRMVSRAWHSLLECDSSATKDEKSRELDEEVSERHIVRRWELLRQSSPIEQLHRLFSSEVEFRPKQEEVLRAVYDGASPILAVMPTGSGKSLIFILPASYEFSGTTIVVVPLLALQQDILSRTTKLSVPTRIWGQDCDDIYTNIILVTPESARTTEFLSYFHRLRTTGQIDRVVFDECHIFSESDITFRPAIKELVNLFQFNVRLVFLTATLPISQELPFWYLLGLQRVPVRTIRADTTRHNLAYMVSYVKPSDRVSEVQRHIQLLQSGKVIVYCKRKQTVTTLAVQLGCLYYFSSYENKTASLKEFIETERGVIVSTNALGLGIDIPDVRMVIHYDCPDSIVAYAQESGRAGRDGKPSRCILFTQEFVTPAPEASYEHRKRPFDAIDSTPTDPWLQRYIGLPSQPVCRRTILSEYLDGIYRSNGCDGSAACDICDTQIIHTRTRQRPGDDSETTLALNAFQSQERGLEFVRREVQTSQMETAILREHVGRFFSSISMSCFQCEAYGIDSSHSYTECPEERDVSYGQAVQTIRQTIHFDRYSGCFSCGMPQELCQTFVRTAAGMTKSKDSKDCTYQKALFEAAGVLVTKMDRTRSQRHGIYMTLGLDQEVEDKEGDTQKRLQKVVQRLGRKTRWLGWETNFLFRTTVSWYVKGILTDK